MTNTQTTSTAKRLFTMAVDYDGALERQLHWLTSESDARRYYERERKHYPARTALVDGTGLILVEHA